MKQGLEVTNLVTITQDEKIENGEKTMFLEIMPEKFLKLLKDIFL